MDFIWNTSLKKKSKYKPWPKKCPKKSPKRTRKGNHAKH